MVAETESCLAETELCLAEAELCLAEAEGSAEASMYPYYIYQKKNNKNKLITLIIRFLL